MVGIKRLYKDEENKIICGVCAGFADYFEIDPTLVRFIWIALSFANGLGIFLYFVGCVIMPKKSEISVNEPVYYSSDDSKKTSDDSKKKLLGLIFIGLGIFIILSIAFSSAVWQGIWGFVLIILGILLILKRV